MDLIYHIYEFSQQITVKTEEYQYWIFLSGDGQIDCADQSFRVNALEVLDIPGGLTVTYTPERDTRIGSVILPGFVSNHHSIEKKPASDTELLRKVFYFAMDFSGLKEAESADLMHYVDSLMYDSLLKTGLKEYRMNSQVAWAIEELNRHIFDAEFDLSAMVESSGYSQSHFRKMFREETGVSPVQYIMLQRINRAKYLLGGEHACTVGEAAEKCSFRDVYYFSRVFKKYVGMSPNEYRRAQGKNHQKTL